MLERWYLRAVIRLHTWRYNRLHKKIHRFSVKAADSRVFIKWAREELEVLDVLDS